MIPYYADSHATLYLGDCRDVVGDLDVQADLTLTDPPWAVAAGVVIHNMNGDGADLSSDWAWDRFESEDEYWAYMKPRLLPAIAKTRPGGSLVVWQDAWKATSMRRLMEAGGCKARQALYWLKSDPPPRFRKVDFMSGVEAAFWFIREGGEPAFNYELGQTPNYWTTTKTDGEQRYHSAQKPLTMLAALIRYLSRPGGLVLDPFTGSGSACVAAKKLNRRSIGVDVAEEYLEIAARRLREIPIPMALPAASDADAAPEQLSLPWAPVEGGQQALDRSVPAANGLHQGVQVAQVLPDLLGG